MSSARPSCYRAHVVSLSHPAAQKHVPDFHASKFPGVANKVFKEFFEAHRKGDMSALAGLTTEELYATLKVIRKRSSPDTLIEMRLLISSGGGPWQSVYYSVAVRYWKILSLA